MAQTVIGVFDSASDAQKAVAALVSGGFSRDIIDVSSSGAYSNSGSTSTGSSSTMLGNSDLGGTTGSTYGTTSTESEGVGSSISRFFSNLFGNDDEANTYSGVAQKGGSIVTVHAQSSSEAEKAADILDDNGAVDVNEKASQYGLGANTGATAATGVAATTLGTTGTASDITTGESTKSIPIIEEELQVGKRTVQTGGARLHSRIVERPVEESLRLREERVTVERTPVDRVATSADFTNFKEGTIELTESAEVPVVSKEARVVEEVSLGKEVSEREETIRDTVRKTEVQVEDLTNSNTKTSGTTTSTSTGSGSGVL